MFVMNLHVFMRVCTQLYKRVSVSIFLSVCALLPSSLLFPQVSSPTCVLGVYIGACVCVVGILALQAL